MTNQEAREELADLADGLNLIPSTRKGQAMQMALDALEEPKAENMKRLSNTEWIDFLSEQFDVSRTSAKEMLHAMMSVKREDNFKKQFSGKK